ncbi:PhnE/PtxC family ABC transporter permease [Siminovitchia sp. 179-K 8D1 HS]|uniref:PhnE/PtxC family ABC transporter permease n=1 Tax=Siminovitchia sp. 179-K 8D1 HS TaxID=3142385 RepID=UPI00399F9C68
MMEGKYAANSPDIHQLLESKKKISIAHKQTQRQQRIFFISILILFVISLSFIKVDFQAVSKGMERIPAILSEMTQLSLSNLSDLMAAMLTTIVIAFLAVLFSLVVSFFLSFLAANNTTPNKALGMFIRYFVMIIRSIPTPIWVLIAVASIGFGPMAGIIGLLFPTTSFLVKAFTAQIEEEGEDVIEAIQSVGGTWWHVIFKGLVPTLFTGLIATLGVRFELDVHESVILGMVGAGGIGYLLQSYIQYYHFANLTLGILLVFITMFLLELFINQIRIRIGNR